MRQRRGFTLMETAAVVLAAGVAVSIAAVSIGGVQPEAPAVKEPDGEAAKAARAAAAQLKCATQVRGIHQAMVVFAQQNNDLLPLPSKIDAKDRTVKLPGADKDTTANMYSFLVYNGFFSPEMLVSPAESSPKIKAREGYEYVNPKGAADPEHAMWDPGLSADFSDGNTGNVSYAHLMLSRARLEKWSEKKFDALLPVVGNRGPKVLGVKRGEGVVQPELAGRSNTFAIHGDPASWEGNIAFGDNHVEFVTQMHNAKRTFKDAAGADLADVWFWNEPEDEGDANIMLGVFTHAGASSRNFKAIWD